MMSIISLMISVYILDYILVRSPQKLFILLWKIIFVRSKNPKLFCIILKNTTLLMLITCSKRCDLSAARRHELLDANVMWPVLYEAVVFDV